MRLAHVAPSAVAALIGAFACAPASAQAYRFPAGDEHYGYFYPTAYMDEGGQDWACGGTFYAGHTGSDYGAGSWTGMDDGRRVVAAAEGVVVSTHDGEFDRCTTANCGTANYVILEHADGRQTWYWHLKQWSIAVSPGQWVSCGTTVGYMGSSGNSTGPHVHFEVREPWGSPGDPFDGPCSAPPTYWIDQGPYGGLPGNACPASGPCNPVTTLQCGQTITTANTAAGATSAHSVYGCGTSTWTGSELAIAFATPVSESVTLAVTGVGADLDLFVLTSPACDGSGAVTCSTNPDTNEEWVTFDASAGATYTVVVDGWEGAVSGFSLTAFCAGAPPPPPPPPPPEDTPADTPADTPPPPPSPADSASPTAPPTDDTDRPADPVTPGAPGVPATPGQADTDATGSSPNDVPGGWLPVGGSSCGCDARPEPSAMAMWALIVAGLATRRRTHPPSL
ncbi:MAG: hypothetical protein RLZZ383_62 [Pseudomonadota bacterium]|jgi:MYXO-CTERM domain-containing protein